MQPSAKNVGTFVCASLPLWFGFNLLVFGAKRAKRPNGILLYQGTVNICFFFCSCEGSIYVRFAFALCTERVLAVDCWPGYQSTIAEQLIDMLVRPLLEMSRECKTIVWFTSNHYGWYEQWTWWGPDDDDASIATSVLHRVQFQRHVAYHQLAAALRWCWRARVLVRWWSHE